MYVPCFRNNFSQVAENFVFAAHKRHHAKIAHIHVLNYRIKGKTSATKRLTSTLQEVTIAYTGCSLNIVFFSIIFDILRPLLGCYWLYRKFPANKSDTQISDQMSCFPLCWGWVAVI